MRSGVNASNSAMLMLRIVERVGEIIMEVSHMRWFDDGYGCRLRLVIVSLSVSEMSPARQNVAGLIFDAAYLRNSLRTVKKNTLSYFVFMKAIKVQAPPIAHPQGKAPEILCNRNHDRKNVSLPLLVAGKT